MRETLPLTCSLDFGYAKLHSWRQGTVLSLWSAVPALFHILKVLWQSAGALMAVWLERFRDLWDSN